MFRPRAALFRPFLWTPLVFCVVVAAGLSLFQLFGVPAAWAEAKNPLTEAKTAPTAPPEVKTATLEGRGAPPEAKMSMPVNLPAEALQVGGYLLIFLFLAALVVHLGKRFRPQWRGGGPIFIEDGRNLAPGIGVRLLRIGARYWLIGVTKERVTLLAELTEEDLLEEEPVEEVEEPAVTPRFPKGKPLRTPHGDEPVLVERGVRR
ncbi:MAG: flagellar biosynthetic protein FliO [Magnetococcales bacterium]|nr:flagellar biosynthetic protein FliO [Magnetococcales bacterium]